MIMYGIFCGLSNKRERNFLVNESIYVLYGLASPNFIYGINKIDPTRIKVSFVRIITLKPYVKAERVWIILTCDSNIICDDLDVFLRRAAELSVPQKWLILINPFTQGGANIKGLHNTVLPMMEEAGYSYEAITSDYAGHMNQLVTALDPSPYSGILIMGGDGSIQECVDGLMKRPDSRSIIENLPIAIYPGGTSNGTSASLGTGDPTWAIFAMIKGQSEWKDAIRLSITDHDGNNTMLYTHMNVAWGFFADIDLKADAYRFLGYSRIYLSALLRIWQMRAYEAHVKYIASQTEESITRDEDTNAFRYRHLMDRASFCKEINARWYRMFIVAIINEFDREGYFSDLLRRDDMGEDLRLMVWTDKHHQQKIPSNESLWSSRLKCLKCLVSFTGSPLLDDPDYGSHLSAKAFQVTFPPHNDGDGILVAVGGERFENCREIYGESVKAGIKFIRSPLPKLHQ